MKKPPISGAFFEDLKGKAGCGSEPAQGTGSDRKDAKAVIHDTLGPRRPGAGRFPPLTPLPAP